MQATGKKVLILATHGFEQSELEVPRDKLKAAGATVHVASPETGEIKGWDKKDWGRSVKVDKALADVKADRRRPAGRRRPHASGALSLPAGDGLFVLLAVAGLLTLLEPVMISVAPLAKAMCNSFVPLVVVSTRIFPCINSLGYSKEELPY